MNKNKKYSRYVNGQAVQINDVLVGLRFATLKRFIDIISTDPWIERWKVKFSGDPDLYERDIPEQK